MWEVVATKKGRLPVRVEKRPPNKHVTIIFNVRKGQQALLVALKKSLGTGGAIGENHVEIQGDMPARVERFLLEHRANLYQLSSKDYPVLAPGASREASEVSAKTRKKPRWQKARNAGPVTLCANPRCTWRYCTSSITGECVQDAPHKKSAFDDALWILEEEDMIDDAAPPNIGQIRQTSVEFDNELLCKLGMLPTKIERQEKSAAARKVKITERQSKRAQTYAAQERRPAPPPIPKQQRRYRHRRRPRIRRKTGGATMGRPSYDIEEDFEYEPDDLGSASAFGDVGYGSSSLWDYNNEDTHQRFAGNDDDDVQHFKFHRRPDIGSGDVDGLKDEQVMQFVKENDLDTAYGSILEDAILTCSLARFWKEVLVVVSSDSISTEEAFLQCLVLFQETTITGVSWTCGECTYVNTGDSRSCAMCGSQHRSTSVAISEGSHLVEASESSWSCQACTYDNGPERVRCVMCDTARAPARAVHERDVKESSPETMIDPLQHFVDMGFSKEAAQACYERANCDADATLELLLTGL